MLKVRRIWMNKRIEWIDIAKAVAIVLVGIGHYSCPKILMAFIYSFHMPLWNNFQYQ